MYGWYYDPTFILVFAGLILTLIASAGVKSTFSRYSRVRCMAGYTGAQAAQEVLRISGIYDVRIERVAGELTDHYDPRAKVLRLSDSTYGSNSVAAVSVVMQSSIRKDMDLWYFEAHWFRQPTSVPVFPGRFLLQG